MILTNGGYYAFTALISLFTLSIYRWVLTRSTIKSKSDKKAVPKEKTTFRVTGIPASWDRQQIHSFLQNQESMTDVSIESLISEEHSGLQVATVTFGNTVLQHGPGWSIPIPSESNSRKLYLTVDKDFHGITALYTPPAQDHKIDVIALSGLGGHAFGSFKERGGSHMWLRDSLPFDLTLDTSDQPIARVMIYGYGSTVVGSKSMQNIEDLATKFNASLQKLANASIIRPIILIGHSLGGLIIKQALISLSRSENEDDRNLIRAIYGIVFFGTPHDGMDITSLIPMAGDSSPNRFLIESLSRNNSQTLTMQQREFHKALGDKGNSEVFCFYETLESPTAQRDKFGNWKLTGPAAVLVTKSSATHCRPWEDGAENICAIHRTHSEMVKFGPHDSDYYDVRERLKGLSRRAFTARHRLQTSRAIFLVPYGQNSNFVIRPEPLSAIKKQLDLDQQGEYIQSRRRVSLYGLGGVGKTQIAIAYAYWLQKTSPDISVLWVHASNIDRFRQSYASIAETCNIPGHNDPKTDILLLVSSWLKQQTKMRWLMVIDNADDMDIFFPNQLKQDTSGEGSQTRAALASGNLARYIPDCNHGSVLITTRDKKAGVRLSQGLSPIEIDKMTDDEAYHLVQRIMTTQQISIDETVRLLSKLEHLPLALAQAASFIQENDISIDDYVQLLDESDSAFIDQLSESFETVGRDSETPHAVTTTWVISFEQIRRKEALTSDVLSFLSFFQFQAIPRVFVEHYYQQRCQEQTKGDTLSTAVLIKALGTLKAFSFISEAEDKSLTMHRLVQLVTQKWVINKGQAAKFAKSAMKTMSANYPSGMFETRKICMKYLPHATSVLTKNAGFGDGEDVATLLKRMTGYFLFKGDGVQAENLGTQAADIFKRVSGENHADTIECMGNLAEAYRYQSRYKEAEDLGAQTLEKCKTVLGEEATLRVMGNLALTYLGQNRWKEAEGLQDQVCETSKRVLGEEHQGTLQNLVNLAVTYKFQGRVKEAEGLLVKISESSKKVLGVEHSLTMSCMSDLVSVYLAQRRLEEAEDLVIQVIEMQKRIWGEEHPRTLNNVSDLVYTYYCQGLLEKAEDLGTRVIEVERRVLGEGHDLTLRGSNSLMLVYQGQKRWKQAEELGMRVLEASKMKLHVGEEDPIVLVVMGNLSFALEGLCRMSEAIALMADCVAGLKKIFGRDHPSTKRYRKVLEQWRKSVEESSE